MRALLTALLPALLAIAGLPAAPVQAQTPATSPAPAATANPAPAKEKRIERLHIEDAGSRVDEVRYGGETQSITVQTKSGLPEYEIVPANGARNRPQGERDSASGSSGQRVWKLLNF
ncbi:MAG TPA: hypothetical protein VLJ57_16735 [Burkholderiaceae bacterium]|nr:hypothetical protein [Burkholderiaceae bacterium]